METKIKDQKEEIRKNMERIRRNEKRHAFYDQLRIYGLIALLFLFLFYQEIYIFSTDPTIDTGPINPFVVLTVKSIYNIIVMLLWTLAWAGYKRKPFTLKRLISPCIFALIPFLAHFLYIFLMKEESLDNDYYYDFDSNIYIFTMSRIIRFIIYCANLIIVLVIMADAMIRFLEKTMKDIINSFMRMFMPNYFTLRSLKIAINEYRKPTLYIISIINIFYGVIIFASLVNWLYFVCIFNIHIIGIYFFLEPSLIAEGKKKMSKSINIKKNI